MARAAFRQDFAEAIDSLFASAISAGIVDDVQVVSGYRSSQAQRRLFADWKAGRSDLPAAAPGTSYHEYGLAVDVAVSPADALEDFGLFAERQGFRWGGRFGDPVHIDIGNDVPIQEARHGFKVGNLVYLEGY